MKTDNRTKQQNNAYWKFQEMICEEMRNQWITMDKLVVEIQPKPTKTALHEVFKHISDTMYSKDSTTILTREELNDILDVYMDALSRTGVHIEFPSRDRQSLLWYF